MNKQTLIALGVFLVLGVGMFLYVKQSRKEPVTPSLTGRAPVAPLAQPSFPQSASRSQPGYRVDIAEQQFPSSLPTVTYTQPPSVRPQALLVANALGFHDKPAEIKGSRGTLYTWQQGDETLTTGGEPVEISYTFYKSSRTPIGTQMINSDAVVGQFKNRIGLTMPSVSLVKKATTLYEPTQVGAKETTNTEVATAQRTDYNYTIDGHPIYTRYPNIPALSIQTNGDRALEQFNAYWYAGIKKTESITPIISYEEATQRLLSGEGALLAFNPKDPPLTDIPQKISVQTSVITRAELAYYYTPGNTILAPVFVFYGQGVDTKTNMAVDTLTVVSALPSQAPTP